jgi:hypothetical protein
MFELPKFLQENMEELRNYTNMKFYMLNDFATTSLLEQKEEKYLNK